MERTWGLPAYQLGFMVLVEEWNNGQNMEATTQMGTHDCWQTDMQEHLQVEKFVSNAVL